MSSRAEIEIEWLWRQLLVEELQAMLDGNTWDSIRRLLKIEAKRLRLALLMAGLRHPVLKHVVPLLVAREIRASRSASLAATHQKKVAGREQHAGDA